MVAHNCNPSTWEAKAGRPKGQEFDQPGQLGETWSLLKIQKISWMWWCMPIIPTAKEAKADESLEPRR